MAVKFTISLPGEDTQVLDEYVRDHGLRGRSDGVHAALRLLAKTQLHHDYAAAFTEGDTEDPWDIATSDTW
ncbi:metal-responsive CopG/Arc/MetJ family transcriptional regulator [Rhodococcus sp. 27YEA15]|uniref:ribbon-helix-helix domain-containing protein n=1 Tax=Rhodococcus sp. 27YEA15 TaxID=3156259 RepID=UPI003C7B7618